MFCFCCGTLLSKRRYNLSSDSHARQLSIWKRLFSSKLTELGLRVADIDVILREEDAGRVCYQCLNELEKIDKLQESLNDKISNSVESFLKEEKWSSQCEAVSLNQPTTPSTPPSTSLNNASTTISISDLPHNFHGDRSTPQSSIAVVQKKGRKRPVSVRNVRTPSRKNAIKCLSLKRYKAAAKHCFENEKLRANTISKVGMIVTSEVKALSSCDSILRSQSPKDLTQFKWDMIYSELKCKAPVLWSIFDSATKTRTPRSNKKVVICLCISIILKNRYRELNLVQKIISLILYANHTSKEVFLRLSPLELVVSHSTLMSLVNELGADHDRLVKEQQEKITSTLEYSDCNITATESAPESVRSLFFEEEDSEDDNNDNESDDNDDNSEPDDDDHSSEPDDDDHNSEPDDDEEFDCEDDLFQEFDVDNDDSAPPAYSPITNSDSEMELEDLSDKSIQSSESTQDTQHTSHSTYTSYKIIGDNVDKNVSPRYRRSDNKVKSLHYYHSYAVFDRIDVSLLSSTSPLACLPSPSNRAKSLLPTIEDDTNLRRNIKILYSRILLTTLPFFKMLFSEIVNKHITHRRSSEMSQKSCIVPLGVQAKNENMIKEMVEILKHHHQYVPMIEYCQTHIVSGVPVQEIKAATHRILLGGDQLSQARARTAIKVKSNGQSPSSRLEGFILTVEDWHTKLTFYEVIWKHYMSVKSAGDHGTLCQIRNVLGYSGISNPKKSMNLCEDFMAIVMHAYVTSAAMEVLELESVDDWPRAIPQSAWTESKEQLQQRMDNILNQVVDTYTNIAFNSSYKKANDGAFEYIKQMTSVGSILMEFVDAIKEGDGDRVLRCWRYFLIIFRNSNRKNYAKEAVLFIHEYMYSLTPQLRERLLYSRFVNTTGIPGKNISADLQMEHLNRLLKNGISALASNKTEQSITRLSKALGTIAPVLANYDKINDIEHHRTRHGASDMTKDVLKVINYIKQSNLFQIVSDRKLLSFPNIKSLLHKSTNHDLVTWIETHI